MSRVMLIRADANEKIGIGHVMRSMTIADAFRKAGYQCIFVCSEPVDRKLFSGENFEVIALDYDYKAKTVGEAREISSLIARYAAEFVLLDSYHLNNEYLRILREHAKTICINSMPDKWETDYLVNLNIACDPEYFYVLYSGTGTKLLLGAEYMPIREEFLGHDYTIRDKVRRIMVTTGGGDQHNFMTGFLESVKVQPCFKDIQFVFISGACNVHYEELVSLGEKSENVSVISSPDNMAEIMLDCDLAIASGGTTVLELSVIGVPTIGIAVADDQVDGLEFMHKGGMIQYAGRVEDVDFWRNIFMLLDRLIEDREERTRMAEFGKKEILGDGAQKITRSVLDFENNQSYWEREIQKENT